MGDGGVTSPPITNKQFILENLPYYMAMGMTYAEYMNGENELVIYYRKADEIRQRRLNEEAWLNGRYIYEALCTATVAVGFPDKTRSVAYPEKPHPITEEEMRAEELAQRKKMYAKVEAWATRVNNRRGVNSGRPD